MRDPTVYVVLGEAGEYSERDVWICGVYLTEEEAILKLFERLRVRRVWEQWDQSWRTEAERIKTKKYEKSVEEAPSGESVPSWSSLILVSSEEIAEAKRIVGPQPEKEEAERLAVVEVPLATWGRHGGPYERGTDWKSPEHPIIDVGKAT